jgi:hypothetical protein
MRIGQAALDSSYVPFRVAGVHSAWRYDTQLSTLSGCAISRLIFRVRSPGGGAPASFMRRA